MKIAITAKEIEDRLVSVALKNAKDTNSAMKKLVTLYTPHHQLIKGKYVPGPSLIEDAVAKTLDAINAEPPFMVYGK